MILRSLADDAYVRRFRARHPRAKTAAIWRDPKEPLELIADGIGTTAVTVRWQSDGFTRGTERESYPAYGPFEGDILDRRDVFRDNERWGN